ncbi:hypothetical protein M106_3925 [Bacteroides fragilis str. 1009-4-F |nr:hypothetical protein M106_3925 [Bacteroides fragilis str. 1009-4-F \
MVCFFLLCTNINKKHYIRNKKNQLFQLLRAKRKPDSSSSGSYIHISIKFDTKFTSV